MNARQIEAHGGPWPCICGAASTKSWRCSECGRDLVGGESNSGTYSAGVSPMTPGSIGGER